MANKEGLGVLNPKGFQPEAIGDFYKLGIIKMQQEYQKGTQGLSRFLPISPGIMKYQEELSKSHQNMRQEEDSSDLESSDDEHKN